jgi:hypothetical protein
MDPFQIIQSQLCEYIQENSIVLPLSSVHKELLKQWKPDLAFTREAPLLSPESKKLSRLRAMILDQDEPEFCLSFFSENNTLHSSLYGNFPSEEAEYIEGLFTQRYPLRCSSIPGESTLEELPQVFFYSDWSDQFQVTSIIDVVGVSLNNEFHVICPYLSPTQGPCPDRRDSILRGLEISLGSSLPAELLFYVLISSIQERSTLLGSLPINLKDLQNPEVLFTTLKTLTRVVLLELSLSTLNSSDFIPVKDPETEQLRPSILQLPSETLLFIDETKITQGPLSTKGVENLDILMQLVHSQSLIYDFGFSKIPFPTDLRFLLVSSGKSMLKVKQSLIVNRCNYYEFNEEDREYLSQCSKVKVSLPDSVIKTAQDYFVQKRKENKITVDDFHLILLLTRLVAQSHNQSKVSQAHWEAALALQSSLSQQTV